MSIWLTEKEFRQSGAQSTGITINVAFLRDIKHDSASIHDQTKSIANLISSNRNSPREVVELLMEYRDALQTYLALEEFYGYFKNAPIKNPPISTRAQNLKNEHEELLLSLNDLIEMAEQIVYRECSPQTTLDVVADLFENFARRFEHHEQQEMDLMMRLCNEELGVGD